MKTGEEQDPYRSLTPDQVSPAPWVALESRRFSAVVPFAKCLARPLAQASVTVIGNPAADLPAISPRRTSIYSCWIVASLDACRTPNCVSQPPNEFGAPLSRPKMSDGVVGKSACMREVTRNPPPERPARYDAAWSRPPVPACTEVEFRLSSAFMIPLPNIAALKPPPLVDIPRVGKVALSLSMSSM